MMTTAKARTAQQLRDQALSYEQIADRLGVSPSTVRRHLNPIAARQAREDNRRRRISNPPPSAGRRTPTTRGQTLPWEGVPDGTNR